MLSATSRTTDSSDAAPILTLSGYIELFLSGASDGGALLRSLYDDVLDEKVPDRLSAVCRMV
jgi:hypothetical protein